MPYRLKIKFGEARFSEVIASLRRVNSEAVLDGVDLTPTANKALRFLKSIFPRSTRGDGSRSKSNQAEFGMHLGDGWNVNPIQMAVTRGFDIVHKLSFNERARTVLQSLDTGSKAYSFFTLKPLTFKDKRSGAKGETTVAAGEEIHKGARRGVYYTNRTMIYIQRELIPRVTTQVNKAIERERF